MHQVALAQDLQANGGGRQAQTQTRHQRGGPRHAERHGYAGEQRGATEHLRAAPAKNRPAQIPQALWLKLQANQEQHQDHAKLGEMKNVLHIRHQAQPPGAYGNASAKIANDGAQAEFLGQRHGHHGRREVDETVDEPGGCVGHRQIPARVLRCVGAVSIPLR